MERLPTSNPSGDQELHIDLSGELPTTAATVVFNLVPIPETVTAITPETLTEATERVESFLDTASPLFTDSHESWGLVRAVQEGTYEVKEEFVRSSVLAMPLNPKDTLRRIRRGVERSRDSRTSAMFGAIGNMAIASFVKDVQPSLRGVSDIDGRREKMQAALEENKQSYINSVNRSADNVPDNLKDGMVHLIGAYLQAHYADYEVMRAVSGFLSRGIVIIPFLDRIQDLSALGQKGIVEFPGLLETLAAHHKMSREKSPLAIHIDRIIGRPKNYATEFMGVALDEKSEFTMRSRKELSAALGFIRLIGSKLFENQDELVEQLASHWQEWPAVAITALQVYTDSKVQKSHTSLNRSLEPFLRKGRLPATENKVIVNPKHRSMKQAKGGNNKAKVLTTASKNHDMTDVTTPEVAREPITKFGWLVNTGTTTKQNIYSVKMMEGDDAIGALLQTKHVRNFLTKYQHHVSEETIRNVLTLIATHPNPIKAPFSDRWEAISYYLEKPVTEGNQDIKATRRHLHRASLRDTPGTVRNEITHKTRLAYDIVDINGELTILMYGIFLKQDIERINALPMR